MLGVAHRKNISNFKKHPFLKKNVSPFGPAVWPAIHIYIYLVTFNAQLRQTTFIDHSQMYTLNNIGLIQDERYFCSTHKEEIDHI